MQLPAGYQISHQVPSVADYLRLRALGPLSGFAPEAAEKGLAGTLFAAVLIHQDQPVGMGRIVGDGGCFVQVVDIVVDPAHRGKGLAKVIMAALMRYVDEALPPSVFVSLLADVPANHLYEQFGFRETAPRSLGMSRRAAGPPG